MAKKNRFALCLLLLAALLGGCRQEGTAPEDKEAKPPEQSPAQNETQAPEKPEPPAEELDPPAQQDPDAPAGDLPESQGFSFADLPEALYFSSGVGAWRTELRVQADGSFSGDYSDMDMGDAGEDYPNGTQYVCQFSGQFTQPEKVGDYAYSVKIQSITSDEPGQESYVDGVRVITSAPVGLENSGEILIYLPQAPVSQLPESFLIWTDVNLRPRGTLEYYGVYNVENQTAFVG